MAESRIVDDLSTAGAGPFVLLAGAGISLWHPSSLPTWSEFNTALLNEAIARARRALPAQSPIHQVLERLTVDDIGSKAFSNALVEILTGESYFDVVTALAVTQPNGAHHAIARLARRGVIAAIVTTNFDTLLERAIVAEGFDADVYSQPRDYERSAGSGVPIFKIHGSASEESGLIDTVGQKLRGLPPVVRERLREWFAKHSVVALGYSGGDLEFGADYLALGVIPVGSDRVWWVVRPEDRDRLEPTTRAIVDQRGTFVALPQDKALEEMGAGPVTLEWNVESRGKRLALLRKQSSALFKKHGALNTLAFCMRLMSAAGQTGMAATMWKAVADEIGRRKRQTVAGVGPAMRALAAEGNRLFGVLEQEAWACRQLADIRKRRTNPRTAQRGTEADLIRDVRSEALAYLAIGDAKVRRVDDDGAGLAMQRAMECCEFAGDLTLLPGVYRLYGWRDSERFQEALESSRPLGKAPQQVLDYLTQHEDRALNYLQAAEAAALVGGNVDAIESARLRAELFVVLGEYDAAVICLERLAERVGLGIHRETQVRIETTLGEIDVRQGRIDKAMDRWNACLTGLAHGNPMLEAHVQSTIVGRAGFSPAWRPTVITHCEDLLSKMTNGDLPADGRSDLVHARDYLEKARDALTALGSKPLDPGFLQALDLAGSKDEFMRWPPYYVRQTLIAREFEGDVDGVLESLDQLVGWQYHTAYGARTLDAATAHARRARRDGSEEQRFFADVNLAAIRRWLGDADAEAWFVTRSRLRALRSPDVRAGLERRLPYALWATKSETPGLYPRRIELDLDDALALKWMPPATGEARERTATARFAENDFVMGRLLALQAIASYRDEGDPGGVARALKLLQDAGARDSRSSDDPYRLCL